MGIDSVITLLFFLFSIGTAVRNESSGQLERGAIILSWVFVHSGIAFKDIHRTILAPGFGIGILKNHGDLVSKTRSEEIV